MTPVRLALFSLLLSAARLHAIAINYNSPGNDDTADIRVTTQTIMASDMASYFMSEGFGLGGGGYCGFQQTDGNSQLFLFSMWDGAGVDATHQPLILYNAPGATLSRFGGEGTGWKYANNTGSWTINAPITTVVRTWAIDAGTTGIGYWTHNAATNAWTHQVSMSTPTATPGTLGGDSGFMEDYLSKLGQGYRSVSIAPLWERNASTGVWKQTTALTLSATGNDKGTGVPKWRVVNDANGVNVSYGPALANNPTATSPASVAIAADAQRPFLNGTGLTSLVVKADASGNRTVAWAVDASEVPQFSYSAALQDASGNALQTLSAVDSEIRTGTLSTNASGAKIAFSIENILGDKVNVSVAALPAASSNLVVLGVYADTAANLGANKWAIAAPATLAATDISLATALTKVDTASAGTLALTRNETTAPSLSGYNILFIGSLGTAAAPFTLGNSGAALAAVNGGWRLGGGGGELVVAGSLAGANTLFVGNGQSTGYVTLTNAANSFTGGVVFGGGVGLIYTDAAALGSGVSTLGYGNQSSYVAGVLPKFVTNSAGILAINRGATQSAAVNLTRYDNVSLGAMGGGSATLSGTITPGANGFRFGGAGDLNVTSVLGGSSGLIVDGQYTTGGVTRLSAANTFAGGVTVRGAKDNAAFGSHTLKLQNDLAIGSGKAVTVSNGGVIDFNGHSVSLGDVNADASSILTNSPVIVSTTLTPAQIAAGGYSTGSYTGNYSGANTGSSQYASMVVNTDTQTPVTLTLAGSGTSAIASTVSGQINFLKTGAGTVTMSSVNDYTGSFDILAGTVVAGSDYAFGTPGNTVTVHAGGTLDLAGYNAAGIVLRIAGSGASGTSALTNSAAGTFTPSFVLTGDATLGGGGTTTIYAPASLDLSGYNLTVKNARVNFASESSVKNGDITGGANSAFYENGTMTGTGSTGKITLGTGSEFEVRDLDNTGVNGLKSIVLDGGKLSNGGIFSPNGDTNGGGAQSIMANAIAVNSGGGTINGNNTGFGYQLWFTGTISGTGALTIAGGKGAEFQGDTSGYTGALTIASGAKLTMNGAANQTLAGTITGFGGLIKNGANTLTLSGTNSGLSGAITVNAGKLIAGSNTAFGTGFVSVVSGGAIDLGGRTLGNTFSLASGATLGGAGTASRALSLVSGAHLAPGAANATLTLSGGVTLAANSVIDLVIGSTGSLVKVSGGTLTGPGAGNKVTLNLTADSGLTAGSYRFLDTTGATTSGLTISSFGIGTGLAGYDATLSQSGNFYSLNLVASAVPEPATYGLLGGGTLAAIALVRRRRIRRHPRG